MKIYEVIGEQLDPDLYEEVPPETITEIAQDVFSKMYPGVELSSEDSEDGYAILTTNTDDKNEYNDLYLVIGCSIADGGININLATHGPYSISSGPYKGAVTEIIRSVYQWAVNEYGVPSKKGTLNLHQDAGHGVWQHIGKKLGLEVQAYNTN